MWKGKITGMGERNLWLEWWECNLVLILSWSLGAWSYSYFENTWNDPLIWRWWLLRWCGELCENSNRFKISWVSLKLLRVILAKLDGLTQNWMKRCMSWNSVWLAVVTGGGEETEWPVWSHSYQIKIKHWVRIVCLEFLLSQSTWLRFWQTHFLLKALTLAFQGKGMLNNIGEVTIYLYILFSSQNWISFSSDEPCDKNIAAVCYSLSFCNGLKLGSSAVVVVEFSMSQR